MQNLTKEYLALFNAITDAEAALETVCARLMEAQQNAEELYLADAEGTERKND